MIIILSHPQMGENIGAVARVMSNFGFSELRVINPRDGWPNAKANANAANGEFVIENAEIFNSLSKAISDLTHLYGTASQPRNIIKKVFSPSEFVKNINNKNKIGILFGCEKSGLTNEEISYCDGLIKIPTSELNTSLNIAQAVAIICYEYFNLARSDVLIKEEQFKTASKNEINSLLNYLEDSLVKNDFFKSEERQPTQIINIRNLLTKANLSAQDVSTLFGIFRNLNNE